MEWFYFPKKCKYLNEELQMLKKKLTKSKASSFYSAKLHHIKAHLGAFKMLYLFPDQSKLLQNLTWREMCNALIFWGKQSTLMVYS